MMTVSVCVSVHCIVKIVHRRGGKDHDLITNLKSTRYLDLIIVEFNDVEFWISQCTHDCGKKMCQRMSLIS